MAFKESKLFGKDEDGEYLGRVEQIGLGHGRIVLPFGIIFDETPDDLMISNRKSYAWLFSVFTGYLQLGIFKIKRPHNFYEGQNVIVTKKDDKIVKVEEA